MASPSLPSDFTFSQSSLQDYSDCPRRFQLRYMERLQWPAIETEPVLENERRQQEGQFFHLMVQQHLIGLPVGKLTSQAKSADLSRWWENYLNARELRDLKDLSSIHTELILTTPLGSYRLLAKYDLIAIKLGDRTLIYDWKTYRKRPRDEWMVARMQTRVYRALLVQAGAALNGGIPFSPEQIEMIYWYADYPSEPACFPYQTIQYKRDWDALNGLISEISNHRHFPLTEEEKKCAYCTYRSYCNRGRKAGAMDDKADEVFPSLARETELTETDFNFEQIAEIEF